MSTVSGQAPECVSPEHENLTIFLLHNFIFGHILKSVKVTVQRT